MSSEPGRAGANLQMTYRDVVLWIASRSGETMTAHGERGLLALFDEDPPLTVQDIDHSLNAICERRDVDAELARIHLRRALKAGSVTANGRFGLVGRRQLIPALEWTDLSIGNLDALPELQSGVNARRSDWEPGQPAGHHYIDILFDRGSVLSAFPEIESAVPCPPWAQGFAGEPSFKRFVLHPDVVALANARLADRGGRSLATDLGDELAAMWNMVPLWKKRAKSKSIASMLRRYTNEIAGKSPMAKNHSR